MIRAGPLVLRASSERSECYNGAQPALYEVVARLVRLDYIFEPAYSNTLVSEAARALVRLFAALKRC